MISKLQLYTQDSLSLSEIPKQKFFRSYWTKSSSQEKQASNLSIGDWRFKQTGRFLPAPEKLFLEDMLSDNPWYLSNNQLNPSVFWEEAAATLPEYQGPWQTALCITNIPKE
ncbi:hypothetical protein KOW79_002199 [Hemibagrus wyckioides]|uniref:Uncharacterized protein n=1 Tax=Hemibagrus wyckioides TaxID=337641 RepID=A0A9D3P3J1_9TELE|nr:hypothetical protein KOW79_002199 [Hemibagrus wyckioides]